MKRIRRILTSLRSAVLLIAVMVSVGVNAQGTVTLSKEVLMDKIKGGWAGQTIGCAYGGPTE